MAASVLRAAAAAAMRAAAARAGSPAAIPAAFSHAETALLSLPPTGFAGKTQISFTCARNLCSASSKFGGNSWISAKGQGGATFVAARFTRGNFSSNPKGEKFYKITAYDVSANGLCPKGEKLYQIIPADGSANGFDHAAGRPYRVAVSKEPLTNEEVRKLASEHQKWSSWLRK